MNPTRIISLFEYQVQREIKKYKQMDKCPSYWQKLLFVNSLQLSPDDWRKIRTPGYWIKCDSLEGIQKDQFILSQVTNYLTQT